LFKAIKTVHEFLSSSGDKFQTVRPAW